MDLNQIKNRLERLNNIIKDKYPISIKKGNHYGALHKI